MSELKQQPSQQGTPDQYDAIIVGAGVIGGAVAYELARRGHRTISIDKGPGPGYGSTSASSAVIRFSYSTETGVAAAAKGVEACARNLREKFPDAELIVAKILPCHAPKSRFYEDILLTNAEIDKLNLGADPKSACST